MATKPAMITAPGPDGAPVEIKVSSPDKVVYPEPGVTKLELVEYLLAVAGPFLAHNGDRPIALQRFRDGIGGEEFFSKNPPKGMPDWMRSVVCTYPSARSHPQIVLDSPAALAWCAQMNTITFHPWPVRSDDNDHPDELRIDLDPQPGTGFAEAVEAALGLREVMAEAGLHPWVKTSGNRGVHVFAPIEREHDFLTLRHAAISLGRELERRMPDLVTTAWWKELRGARILADFNQMNRDRTMAGAYSPRPLPTASVSMPVTWEELPDVDPREFTVRSAPEVLARRGDAWADIRRAPTSAAGAVAMWQADLDRGWGEEPFPPDYPKMPGEPPRVQPSKKNEANWTEDGTRVE